MSMVYVICVCFLLLWVRYRRIVGSSYSFARMRTYACSSNSCNESALSTTTEQKLYTAAVSVCKMVEVSLPDGSQLMRRTEEQLGTSRWLRGEEHACYSVFKKGKSDLNSVVDDDLSGRVLDFRPCH